MNDYEIQANMAEEVVEDEVDLLCVQILRRLSQLKQRKAADIALKTICDATIAELQNRSREVKARAFKREQARDVYTETIAETDVAMQKVIATADVVAEVLQADVAQDDPNDVPGATETELLTRGDSANMQTDSDGSAANVQKSKRRKKRGKK